MKRAGQIVLTPLPFADLLGAKLRPVLRLSRLADVRQRLADWIVGRFA